MQGTAEGAPLGVGVHPDAHVSRDGLAYRRRLFDGILPRPNLDLVDPVTAIYAAPRLRGHQVWGKALAPPGLAHTQPGARREELRHRQTDRLGDQVIDRYKMPPSRSSRKCSHGEVPTKDRISPRAALGFMSASPMPIWPSAAKGRTIAGS